MLSLLFEFAGGLSPLACPTTRITRAVAPRFPSVTGRLYRYRYKPSA
jgi:hypothetical protein